MIEYVVPAAVAHVANAPPCSHVSSGEPDDHDT